MPEFTRKRTKPEDFDRYLKEFEDTAQPAGLRVLSGVKTELVDSDGGINIPPEAVLIVVVPPIVVEIVVPIVSEN